MSDFVANPWAFWLLAAVVAGVLEITVPYFTFCFASFAALVAAVVSLSVGIPAQIATFGVALLASIFLLRPWMLKKFHRTHSMPSRSQALVGAKGVVTEAIDRTVGTGRVVVSGEDWSARSNSPVGIGQTVVVEGHDGIVLLVRES